MALKGEGGEVPSLEERVAHIEGRLQDHTTAMGHLRSDVQDVREVLRQAGERVDRLGERVDRLADRMDRRFDAVDQKFTWVVGIQVAMLVTIVGALISGVYR